MATAVTPLLEEAEPLRLTETGREVLAGRQDHVALTLDRAACT
jgi:hypothetical protein